MSNTEAQVLKQFEFYFGDSNLPGDTFLKQLVGKSEQGWVPIQTIMDFNRMKKITTDMELVAKALSESKMLQLSEDKKNVRRILPLPEVDDSKDRTIYVKRINREASLDDIITFFDKLAPVAAVRMRYIVLRDSKEKNFKGSAFVEFKTKEGAQKVMKMEGELKWDDKTDPLILYWKKDYHKQKNEERKQFKRARDQEEKVQATDEFKKKYEGCIVKVENIGDAKEGDNFSFVTIKDEMRKLGGQKQIHVEYPAGNDHTAYVRMIDRKGANAAVANAKNRKVILRGNEVTLSVLSGEEEQKVLEALSKAFFDLRAEREARRQAKKQKTDDSSNTKQQQQEEKTTEKPAAEKKESNGDATAAAAEEKKPEAAA